MLRSKHPTEDLGAIASGKSRGEQYAVITTVRQQEQPSNVTNETLDVKYQIPEIINFFEEATVKVIMKKINPLSAAGTSRLRYNLLQAVLCDELFEDLTAFATLIFFSRGLPEAFWILHTSINLSALGQNVRLVGCGDVLRRFVGAVYCHQFDRQF